MAGSGSRPPRDRTDAIVQLRREDCVVVPSEDKRIERRRDRAFEADEEDVQAQDENPEAGMSSRMIRAETVTRTENTIPANAAERGVRSARRAIAVPFAFGGWE
jgi:hypothetical protein